MQPILTVNLSNNEVGKFIIPEEWEKEFIGGASLAARILYDYLIPELDPLDPQSPLLFLNGPLSGTAGPAVGRFVVCGRSPATRLWGESNCGGFWGVELRKTGYDGLLVTGRSDKPVYLFIEDGQVNVSPADQVWGMETYQTQKVLLEELDVPGTRVACIGPAGEALIPFSLILSDHGRVAGRTGMGAIMGSKNLKAIAVKGTGRIPVHDPAAFNDLRSQANKELKDDPVSQVARELGTASVADYFDYLMEMPKRYFTRGTSTEELSISGVNIKNNLLSSVSACHACVIACGRVVDLGDGKKRKGAEFETLAGFGPNLLIDDPIRITKFGELCDRYGMDSISLANVIGLAMLLYDRGLINLSDTDGIILEWGNADGVEQLIHKTVKREGIGKFLALGAQGFGRQFQSESLAVHVNGLEVAFHDPRGATGMSLVYATSPRGACHNQSDYYLVEVGQVYNSLGMTYYPPRAGAEKVMNVARHQDWRTVFNSLVMCFFANVPPEMVVELINVCTGSEISLADMILTGERGWNLKRVINHRLGLRRGDDRLPKGFMIPYEDDPSGYVPDFTRMLEAYYNIRDWDKRTGFPKNEKLAALNLDWAIKDLDQIRREL
ncbi:MAG: aldehyde ferredoxin oxidoreductase family protein [Chloroflexota bacterium]|nr:MAG: aldehyde ferredoxin oxidoreductase family protein [Chloroflexota bacterium]